LLRDFSVQSVASINSLDLLPAPAPAPERKDKGDDSFSNMLDAAAKPADDPGPEAKPSVSDDSLPPPAKTKSRPADDRSAQPKDDSGDAKKSCKPSGGDTSKTGDANSCSCSRPN
jgi:hypothetical protein